MSDASVQSGANAPEGDWEETTGSFEADPKSLTDLKSLRKLIDQKNKSIVRLLNRRAGYALRIAEVKAVEGLAIRDDEREKEVLKKVSRYNKGPLSDEALHRIFNCIMEEHRRLEADHNGADQPESSVTDMGIDHER